MPLWREKGGGGTPYNGLYGESLPGTPPYLGRVPHSTVANVKMWLNKAVIDGMQGGRGKQWLMGYQMQFSLI